MRRSFALLGILALAGLLLGAFAPVFANTGGTTPKKENDRLEPSAPGWPKTFGPGTHNAPDAGGRMFTVTSGSIKIDCRSDGTFVWHIRSRTTWSAGQSGDDWGNTTF